MTIPGSAISLLTSGAGGGYQIERSLRFNDDDSAYLSRTPSVGGGTKIWTLSCWVKKIKTSNNYIFSAHTDVNNYSWIKFDDGGIDVKAVVGGVTRANYYDASSFRDPSAWYHLVVSSNGTSGISIYVNGVSKAVTAATPLTSVYNYDFNKISTPHRIGGWNTTYSDNYLADFYWIDNQNLAASDFGEFDANGVWQPIKYTGTYGTNGFHLDFSDNTSTTTIAEDSSGNGNHWTANNISVAAGADNDSLLDSPTNGTQTDTGAGGEVSGNYCTLNDVFKSTNGYTSISNGGLEVENTSALWTTVFGTTALPSSGKWYWEATNLTANILFGIVSLDSTNITADNFFTASSISHGFYPLNGNVNSGPGNSSVSYSTAPLSTDYIGVALDMDAGELTFYKNGSSLGVAKTGLTGNWIPALSLYNTGYNYTVNFGQRPFSYSAPSGFKALCTANLDTPTIEDGSTAMDVALYTGNGSTQTISGLNFPPDLVWIKNRSTTNNHKLTDTVRGATKELESNTTDAEVTNADGLTAFNSDGFDLGADVEYNTSAESYVAWTWKGGGTAVSNTDGSITSSVRANQSAGFSIVNWTGTGSNATIGHGLNSEPYLVVIKNRSTVSDWVVYNNSVGATKALFLQNTSAGTTASTFFQNTAPTSSVFYTGTNNGVALSGSNFIAYCFAPVEGYSSFGSYTGNGNADGPFVYTGFKPRWIMVKSTGVNGWVILDTARDDDNLANKQLIPNLGNAEDTVNQYFWCDILSNGFKLRTTGTPSNASGVDFIYAAFAEHPFRTARAR